MEDNNVLYDKNGQEIPLPPENPIEDGIVVPVGAEDDKE